MKEENANDPAPSKPLILGVSYALVFSGGGRLAVLSRKVAMWDVGARIQVWEVGPVAHPASAAFSPDNGLLAVKNASGAMVILDAATGKTMGDLANADEGEGSGPEFSADGQSIVDGSWAGWLRVRSVGSGAIEFAHEYPGEMITAVHPIQYRARWLVVHSIKTSLTAAAGTAAYCSVWEWPFRDRPLFETSLGASFVTSSAVSPDGAFLALIQGSSAVALSVIRVKGGANIASTKVNIGGSTAALRWSPDGTRLASVQAERVVEYNWPGLAVVNALDLPNPACVAYAPDGGALAMGSWTSGRVVDVLSAGQARLPRP